MMAFPQPPGRWDFLGSPPGPGEWVFHGTVYRWLDDRPPGGAVVPFLGERHTLEQLQNDEFGDDRGAERIRSWMVKTLQGASFTAESQAQVATALHDLLRQACPGIDWPVPGDCGGPLQKYLILHTTVPAPPDKTTGQPMELELYGGVVVDPNSPEFKDGGLGRMRPGQTLDEMFPPLVGPIHFILRNASYANVRHPGVGVGFYL